VVVFRGIQEDEKSQRPMSTFDHRGSGWFHQRLVRIAGRTHVTFFRSVVSTRGGGRRFEHVRKARIVMSCNSRIFLLHSSVEMRLDDAPCSLMGVVCPRLERPLTPAFTPFSKVGASESEGFLGGVGDALHTNLLQLFPFGCLSLGCPYTRRTCSLCLNEGSLVSDDSVPVRLNMWTCSQFLRRWRKTTCS
jgi:hypothetical protein